MKLDDIEIHDTYCLFPSMEHVEVISFGDGSLVGVKDKEGNIFYATAAQLHPLKIPICTKCKHYITDHKCRHGQYQMDYITGEVIQIISFCSKKNAFGTCEDYEENKTKIN